MDQLSWRRHSIASGRRLRSVADGLKFAERGRRYGAPWPALALALQLAEGLAKSEHCAKLIIGCWPISTG